MKDKLLTENSSFKSMEGKFLIASPYLDDSYFEKSIVYIFAHDQNGALGVIINQKIGVITTEDLLKLINVKNKIKVSKKLPVLFGGPLNTERIIGLSLNKNHKKLSDGSPKILNLHTDMTKFVKGVASDKVYSKLLLIKGISAWDASQLEDEIAENSWFTMPARLDIIFSQKIKYKWDAVIKELGLTNFNHLVSYSGKA